MRFAFRADASASLGLGHLKRCLALAHALRERGAVAGFFSRPGDTDTASLIESDGFTATTLGATSTQGEVADATAFVHAARALRPDVVVVDHYGLGARWHRAVRGALSTRLAAIDDLADRSHDVDLLIDHNLSPDAAAKYADRLNPDTVLLSGPRFALLGPAFATATRHATAAEVNSIGIFMGGADALNLNETALDACRVLAGFQGEIEIATTSANPHLDRLHWRTGNDLLTRLSLDQPDLAAFFARHALHIGAGGGATWERCCIGAPTLAVIAAANQRPVLLPLRELGVLELIPDDPPTADPIARALKPLLHDAPRRAALGRAARTLVDGLGAARVADQLFLLLP
jgi:UDP-2,4-diacetamido-2,4,6-trideoxy-beta-L-altropyranose hydrolase